MGTKIRLTVHFYDGNYYHTVGISGCQKQPHSSREVFSIERDISLMEIEELKKEARLMARQKGILHVIDLDD